MKIFERVDQQFEVGEIVQTPIGKLPILTAEMQSRGPVGIANNEAPFSLPRHQEQHLGFAHRYHQNGKWRKSTVHFWVSACKPAA